MEPGESFWEGFVEVRYGEELPILPLSSALPAFPVWEQAPTCACESHDGNILVSQWVISAQISEYSNKFVI